MSQTHELKIWPEHFETVISGQKTVELQREDNCHFEVGDVLVLREWDPNTPSGYRWDEHTGGIR